MLTALTALRCTASLFFLTACASIALAGANPTSTYVLHAKAGFSSNCTAGGQPDCGIVQPSVVVKANTSYRVYFYLHNVAAVTGVQTAFQWDAGWDLLGSSWNCRANQLSVATPDPNTNGGPTAGTLTTAFDCVTGPALPLIGYMDFVSGGSGCLTQVQSSYPSGNHVMDCAQQIDQANPDSPFHAPRFGRICVGTGGHNACPPVAVPTREEEVQKVGEGRPSTLTIGMLPCTGGEHLPSVIARPADCRNLAAYNSQNTYRYVCLDQYGQPIPNLPLELRLRTSANSGFHEHTANRPVPLPDSVIQGNSGADGRQFRVTHTWSEDAREQQSFLFSLDPQRPCGSQTIPLYNDCVKQGNYAELPDSPSYDKVGAAGNHPERFYGTASLLNTMEAVATEYRALYPTGPKVAYNDMSLPWGGLFDYTDNWQNPHCGHRRGTNADVRVRHLPGDDQRRELRVLLQNRSARILIESNHWHIIAPTGGDLLFASEESQSPLLASLSCVSAPKRNKTLVLAVSVTATVTYSQQTQRYTYVYKLKNLATSTDTVEIFGLRQLLGVQMLQSPSNWRVSHPFQGDAGAVVWSITASGPPPPGWISDSLQLYTSTVAIMPGDSLTGFTIISPNPPGNVQYLARKWGPILPVDQEEIPEPSFWSVGVTGTTTGPISPIGILDEGAPPSPPESSLRPAPNPFSNQTTISFDVLEAADVELNIYDPFGRHVAGVLHEERPAGRHSITWIALSNAGQRLPAGIYFLRLLIDGRQAGVKPLVLIE